MRQKQDNEAENALISTLQKSGVFASRTNRTLQNIATKDLATPEIEQSLVQARSLGQTQLKRFVERRPLSSDREEEERERKEGAEENFHDLICKNIRKPEKERLSVALRTPTWALCYGKVVDTSGSMCFSIVIEGTPSKQRQEADAPRTRRGQCAELLKEKRFRCR